MGNQAVKEKHNVTILPVGEQEETKQQRNMNNQPTNNNKDGNKK